MLISGDIRKGCTVSGAFGYTLEDPGFPRMVTDSTLPNLLHCPACMDTVRRCGLGLYQVAAGDGDALLDPVEQFMVEDWLADLESKRRTAGASGWLP